MWRRYEWENNNIGIKLENIENEGPDGNLEEIYRHILLLVTVLILEKYKENMS
jgi:hypothetical protein